MKKLSPFFAFFPILFMVVLAACEVSTTTTMEAEEKPYVIKAEKGIPITELDPIYRYCGASLYTKTYTVDGQRYQIFWTGNNEGSLVVINLEEQEARIKYYKDNSKSY